MGFLSVARSLRRPASRGIWLQLTLRRALRSDMWMYVYKLELLTFCYLTNINAILLTLTPFVKSKYRQKREETNMIT